MAAKKTLYHVLQVNRQASETVIRAAYEVRLRALGESAAPEVAVERTVLRDALDVLIDPARRALYDDRLREENLRALSSGSDEERPRTRRAASQYAGYEPAARVTSPLSWLVGFALVGVVGVAGGWVYLDYQNKREAHRIEAERRAAEQRARDEEAELRRRVVETALERSDAGRLTAEQRRQERERLLERQRWQMEQDRIARQSRYDEQRSLSEQRRTEAQQARLEQENVRQQQMQLERERRYLQELERSRQMRF